MPRNKLLDQLVYNVFYPLCRRLPVRLSYKLATLKGKSESFLNTERIEKIASTMRQVFGERVSHVRSREIAKYQVGMLSREEMDVYWLDDMRLENIDRFIKLKGLENYQSAKQSGSPVILFTAHFGRLIMPAIALGIKGFATSALTAPVREDIAETRAWFEYLKFKVCRMQTIMKGDFVSSTDPMRSLYRILQRGDTLFVLIDVPPIPGQPFYQVPFLNGQARFPKGIVKLAKKTNALLQPYFAYEQNGQLIGEFLTPLDTALLSEEAILQSILEPVQDKIFQFPEQWWMWPWLDAFWSKS